METITVRKRLESARDDLDRSIAVLRDERPVSGSADFPQDEADVGTSLSEADRADAVLASAMSQRTEVVDALQRIQDGSYGKCADCGKPLPHWINVAEECVTSEHGALDAKDAPK